MVTRLLQSGLIQITHKRKHNNYIYNQFFWYSNFFVTFPLTSSSFIFLLMLGLEYYHVTFCITKTCWFFSGKINRLISKKLIMLFDLTIIINTINSTERLYPHPKCQKRWRLHQPRRRRRPSFQLVKPLVFLRQQQSTPLPTTNQYGYGLIE